MNDRLLDCHVSRKCDRSTKNPKVDGVGWWKYKKINFQALVRRCVQGLPVGACNTHERTQRVQKHQTEFVVRLVGADESEKCDIGL